VSNGQRIGLPVASFMVYIVVGLLDISGHRALNQTAALLHLQNVSVPSTSPNRGTKWSRTVIHGQ
jgi:hypothetical protein